MLCSWTAAFSPSLSPGPSFPECFRFYFWGQQTGKQKREILPWQVVHTPRWFQLNRPGRSNLKLLSESNACSYERSRDWGTPRVLPARQSSCSREPGWGVRTHRARERGRHEAPPLPLLTCSAAASPDMASGDDNGHTGRQREARKEK